MPPDWDDDSPQLARNLQKLVERTGKHAQQRKRFTLKEIKSWHVDLMHGLTADDPAYVGAFRGEKGLEDINVQVGPNFGVDVDEVADAVRHYEHELQSRIDAVDSKISVGTEPGTTALLSEVIELCAWAQAEWVRIHPFVNGNGRIARLIANCIVMRYGLPPFVRLRPRPGGSYGRAGARSMQGDWAATVPVFHELLCRFIAENLPPGR